VFLESKLCAVKVVELILPFLGVFMLGVKRVTNKKELNKVQHKSAICLSKDKRK
jgi:hypothetical protein